MGVRLLFDTNAIIALLNENAELAKALESAEGIFISFVNELEFKSFPTCPYMIKNYLMIFNP